MTQNGGDSETKVRTSNAGRMIYAAVVAAGAGVIATAFASKAEGERKTYEAFSAAMGDPVASGPGFVEFLPYLLFAGAVLLLLVGLVGYAVRR